MGIESMRAWKCGVEGTVAMEVWGFKVQQRVLVTCKVGVLRVVGLESMEGKLSP